MIRLISKRRAGRILGKSDSADKVNAEDLPSFYHYTRQEAFLSILTTRSFWVSHVRHFTDYSEVEYAYGVLHSLIAKLLRNEVYGLEKGFLDKLSKDALPDSHPDIFVLCFSTKFDDLNQWRSYASPGLGYCIGFHGPDLQRFASQYGAQIDHCVYDRDSQEMVVSKLLKEALEDFSSYFPYYGPGEINEGLVSARSESFMKKFSRMVPLFKNPAFKEEAEIRLIFDVSKRNLPIRFRSGLTSIVPYVEAPFALNDLQALVPQTIMVKACSRPEFAAAATSKFLNHSGYEQVLVNSSSIPYREGL